MRSTLLNIKTGLGGISACFDIMSNEGGGLTLGSPAGSLEADRRPRTGAVMRVRPPYGRVWTRRLSSPRPYFVRVLRVMEYHRRPSIPRD